MSLPSATNTGALRSFLSALRRVPRATWVKLAVLVLMVVGGFVLVRFTPLAHHFTEAKMVAFFGGLRDSWWTPLLLTGLYIVCSSIGIPVTPLILGGGAVYGFALGTFYNTVGLIAGGLASFYVARFLGRDFIERIGGRRLRQAERLFERHGFWPLVQTRFIPIPFTLVNFAAAMAGVRAARYALATVVGLVPATVIYTYFTSAFFYNSGRRWLIFFTWIAVLVIFNLIISLPSLRARLRRRERYREVMARRRERGQIEPPPGS